MTVSAPHHSSAPLFRFDHGLSYTTFSLSKLSLYEISSPKTKNIKDESIEITIFVVSTGNCNSAEVIQGYMLPPATASVGWPLRELKGYRRIMLEPAEEKEVPIVVPMWFGISFWNEARSAWMSAAGMYTVEIDGTSEENTLSAPFEVQTSSC